MVHAALTLAVKLQLNLHISRLQSFSIKIQPKIVGLYASIYGNKSQLDS